MPDANASTLKAAGLRRRLSATVDFPDLRDRIYEPSLIELKPERIPDFSGLIIRNQGRDGACTGFALAAVINLLSGAVSPQDRGVSPRMLFEMAKLNDEWEGNYQAWSSLRGALKGLFHNGVCREETAPFIDSEDQAVDWHLTLEQAQEARNIGLGAYYRLRPNLIDYHAALNEVGAIAVSAMTHKGWEKPRAGKIRPNRSERGGHAFAIIGYDADGFLIQNSWGKDWAGYKGHGGIAHWSYEDWAENIIDAWVMRLSVPTPKAFGVVTVSDDSRRSIAEAPISAAPRGYEIQHHYIHLDDGRFVGTGRYSTAPASIDEMVRNLRKLAKDKEAPVKHLLVYAHGGLNGAKDSARRIRAMKPVFLRNGIYPVHLMWETGFTEELFDVIGGLFTKGEERVGGFQDYFDQTVEKFSRGLGRRIWREMKAGAARSFAPAADGTQGLGWLFDGIDHLDVQLHFAGHSAGSLLLGEMLAASERILPQGRSPASFTLMAPACNLEFYDSHYRPALEDGRLPQLQQFQLNDDQELDDRVGPYGKSLLYLVSRAFDTQDPKVPQPLLGMEKYSQGMKRPDNHIVRTSGRKRAPCKATTHGGFDNDAATMNHLLKTILGKSPGSRGFDKNDLKGY